MQNKKYSALEIITPFLDNSSDEEKVEIIKRCIDMMEYSKSVEKAFDYVKLEWEAEQYPVS